MVATSGDGWVLAPPLKLLVEQLDDYDPGRSHVSDGSIASAAHHVANPASDHEPRRAADGRWYVTAVDISNAPWLDRWVLDDLTLDPRVKYLIRNRRYWQRIRWTGDPVRTWVPYTGSNPHNHHVHISLQLGAVHDLSRWSMPGASPRPATTTRPAPPTPKGLTMDDEVKAAFAAVTAQNAALAKGINSVLMRVVQLRQGQVNEGQAEDARFKELDAELDKVQADLAAIAAQSALTEGAA
jgi:hypothetical protein